eukprot:UN23469
MEKDGFAWVCQLVDPGLTLENINLFFDFMKGDGIDGFDQWHAENFLIRNGQERSIIFVIM